MPRDPNAGLVATLARRPHDERAPNQGAQRGEFSYVAPDRYVAKQKFTEGEVTVLQDPIRGNAHTLLGHYLQGPDDLTACWQPNGPIGARSALVWDGRTRRLHLLDSGRDKGWFVLDGTYELVVSDSIHGVLGGRRQPVNWNSEYLADWMFGLASQPASSTAFNEISRTVPSSQTIWPANRIEPTIDKLHVPWSTGQDMHALSGALQEALSEGIAGSRRSGLLLSGGLDSTLLGALLLSHGSGEFATQVVGLEAIDAHSGARIDCLVSRGATWHALELSSAALSEWVGSRLDSFLRQADDLLTLSPAALPARACAFVAMGDLGFDVVVDGEGGDEVCDLPWGPSDMWLAGHRFQALKLLSSDRFRNPRGALRQLGQVLGRREIVAHIDGRATIDPWHRRAVTEDDSVLAAFSRHVDRLTVSSPQEKLDGIVNTAAARSARDAYRTLGELAGVEVISPYFDATVVAHVAALPASSKTSVHHPKQPIRLMLDSQGIPKTVAPGASATEYAKQLSELELLLKDPAGSASASPMASWIDLDRLTASSPGDTRRRSDSRVRLLLGMRWMSFMSERYRIQA